MRALPVADQNRGRSLQQAGFFCIVVALPLVFVPATASPFADIKLVVVALSALLLAASRFEVDRRIAIAASIWVVVLLVAALAGDDPLWSILGSEVHSTGVIALGAAAVLLCAGSGVDDGLRERLPVWFFWTGVSVGSLAVVGRFVDIGGSGWELGSFSSTIGHRVYVGGFLAVPLLATTRLRLRLREVLGLAVIASGLSVTAVRSAWIGASVGLLLVLWVARERRRITLAVLGVTLAVSSAWTVADWLAPEQPVALSAATRFGELGEGSAQERIPVWQANLRAWKDRPAFGTGPATGWGGYLSHVKAQEIRDADRGYADAHNIAVELLATTGAVGLAAAFAIAIAAAMAIGRPTPDRIWALGAAGALAVVHLLQPLNIVLTPIFFLLIGLATQRPQRPLRTHRGLALLLCIVLVPTVARLAASSLERYGSTYASESALKWSSSIEPHRFGSLVERARYFAFEHLTGEQAAAAEARLLIDEAISSHSWHPGSRIEAADIESVLGNDAAAMRWLDDQLRRYPNDPVAMAGTAMLLLRGGDPDEALRYARSAAAIDPELAIVQSILRSIEDTGRER